MSSKWYTYKSLDPHSGWFASNASTDPMTYFKTWREAFDYAFQEASK